MVPAAPSAPGNAGSVAQVTPLGHMQLVPTHMRPPVHAVLQAPQCMLLFIVETQTPPHDGWPVIVWRKAL